MAHLLTHLAQRHHMTLVTWEAPDTPSFYPLPPIERIQLNLLGGSGPTRLTRIMRRPLALRRAVNAVGPDAILSFLDTMNIVAYAATLGLNIPLVVAERSDPERNPLGWTRRSLRDATYRRVPLLVAQSERAASYFPSTMRPRIRVLPSPIFPAPELAIPDLRAPDGRFRVIALGRFTQEKRFELLVRAFTRAGRTRPDWDLAIFGDGPLRLPLENLKHELGMTARIHLPGLTKDVAGELARSHIAALPSEFEGFPNALGEALAAGLPGIGFAGVAGVEEMIVSGETGMLLEEGGGEEALAAALAALMDDAPARARMGETARRHSAKWAPNQVLGQWEDLLHETARRGPAAATVSEKGVL